jgi:hypothetical protein
MAYSVLTHWTLGETLQTQEAAWLEDANGWHIEHSKYIVCQPVHIHHLIRFLANANRSPSPRIRFG